jgi:hypothetical protein
MGPPEKKQKRLTPVDTKLAVLRRTIINILPLWEDYAPARFMETIRHIQKLINDLTPETVEQFIETETDTLLAGLNDLNNRLLRQTPATDESQQVHINNMKGYVGRVQGCLEGQP